jgi:hypothetical protein
VLESAVYVVICSGIWKECMVVAMFVCLIYSKYFQTCGSRSVTKE